MDRRTSIKGLSLLGILGICSVPVYQWFYRNPLITDITQYKSLIAELAETIIPRTDTPGAKDAKVEDYIILIIKDCDQEKIQRTFLNGLSDLIEYTHNKYNCNFIDCSDTTKIEIINYFKSLHDSSNEFIRKVKRKIFGVSFYSHLHELTVEGFCTSELGATRLLAYDYIPGTYVGCEQYNPNQRTWAT